MASAMWSYEYWMESKWKRNVQFFPYLFFFLSLFRAGLGKSIQLFTSPSGLIVRSILTRCIEGYTEKEIEKGMISTVPLWCQWCTIWSQCNADASVVFLLSVVVFSCPFSFNLTWGRINEHYQKTIMVKVKYIDTLDLAEKNSF